MILRSSSVSNCGAIDDDRGLLCVKLVDELEGKLLNELVENDLEGKLLQELVASELEGKLLKELVGNDVPEAPHCVVVVAGVCATSLESSSFLSPLSPKGADPNEAAP